MAATLRAADIQTVATVPVDLPPDHEVKTLERVRNRLASGAPARRVALVATGLAFFRLVSDTSWDVSPRRFIAVAIVALAAWTLSVVQRRRALKGVGLMGGR